jgi:hypothetical protein
VTAVASTRENDSERRDKAAGLFDMGFLLVRSARAMFVRRTTDRAIDRVYELGKKSAATGASQIMGDWPQHGRADA